jgi:uncharacterized protein YprB with RNaseH-like and TPR domain
MDPVLFERLSRLSRARRDSLQAVSTALQHDAPGSASVVPAALLPGESHLAIRSRSRLATPLEKILPGEEIRTRSGACWRHSRPASLIPGNHGEAIVERIAERLSADPPWDLASDSGFTTWRRLGVQKGVFLDLETTGFTGTPVFLAGLLKVSQEGLTLSLYFARDYGEERPLLEALAAEVEDRPVAITYNGKSYDLPFLRERVGRLKVRRSEPRGVVDLLHPARRRWKGLFPDCRLKTLETLLCGRNRGADIDGRLIPDIYHRYVLDRDPRPLVKVFDHNVRDLLTLADVTERVLGTEPPQRCQPPS